MAVTRYYPGKGNCCENPPSDFLTLILLSSNVLTPIAKYTLLYYI